MNLPDTQNKKDHRNIYINQVGIKAYRYPIVYQDISVAQSSVGVFDMLVDLPANRRGTHMSRFIEILNQNDHTLIGYQPLINLCEWVKKKLGAELATLSVEFPFFLKKAAPKSKITSMIDYQATYAVTVDQHNQSQVAITLKIPLTSLCPCSKSISDYGAHNQRSEITLKMNVQNQVNITTIIQSIEKAGSCEVYGILKREDEKYVTEKAYDNPQFVEDMVRNFTLIMQQQPDVNAFEIHAENFESIHNHSAYAMVYQKK